MRAALRAFCLSAALAASLRPAQRPLTANPERLLTIAPSSATLAVLLPNVRSTKGFVRLLVFRSRQGFPGDLKAALLEKNAPASPGMEFTITELPPGDYAVTALHDENGNGSMDTKFFGIPKEGVGASNNPKPRMGPPSFDSARFTLKTGENRLEIRLVY